MKSKMRKKLIAFMLCMVLVICNSVSILADTPAVATTTAEKQVKETKTAKNESASKEDKAAGDEEKTLKQSEETDKEDSNQEEAPEVKTTEKKKETTGADTEKKEDKTDKADEVTTEAADKATTAAETNDKDDTDAAKEEGTTKEDDKKPSKDSDEKNTEEAKDENKDDAETTEAPTELTYQDEDVIVTVSEVNEGAIPEGAELKVVPILKNDTETQAQYTEVEKKIQEKAAETETDIKGFLAYDITFVDEDGNEIEPNSEVKVSMEYKKAAIPAELTAEEAKNAEVSVMHLEEDDAGNVSKVVDMSEAGKVDTLETTDAKQVEKVEMKTESFSVFTITWSYGSEGWNSGQFTIHVNYGYFDKNDKWQEWDARQTHE